MPDQTRFAPLPNIVIDAMLRHALDEDLGHNGDLTTRAVIPAGTQMGVRLNAREAGVVSGLQFAARAFELLDPKLNIRALKSDGDVIRPGDALMEVAGDAASILSAERVGLNFAGRMSGIATMTAAFVAETAGTKARITCTRKTTPGIRIAEKLAVRHGGGFNHRYSLSDAILIKDNHIAARGGIAPVLDAVVANAGHMVRIEIEVDTLAQLDAVLSHGGAHVVLLDNMDTATLTRAVGMIDGRMVAEASGNMRLERIREVAETGVDYISVGALTHSVRCLDLGLDAI